MFIEYDVARNSHVLHRYFSIHTGQCLRRIAGGNVEDVMKIQTISVSFSCASPVASLERFKSPFYYSSS